VGTMDERDRNDALPRPLDSAEARLRELAAAIEELAAREEDSDKADGPPGRYESVGRLRVRLERTRHTVRELRETREDRNRVSQAVDEAISELERAIARAGPRFQ